ncbi:MAG: lytic transglycosylase domain-containing protein [Elusimicrobiota bacterium]
MRHAFELSLFALLLGGPARAESIAPVKPQPTAPASAVLAVSTSPEDDVDVDGDLINAEAAYEAGLDAFGAGDVLRGRAELKKAFGVVISHLDDAALPQSLHAEFESMLYKLHASNQARGGGEPLPDTGPTLDPAPDLNASSQALIDAPQFAASSAPIDMQDISIDPKNPVVQKFIAIYAQRRPRATEQALSRSGLYRDMILNDLKKEGLPSELLYLVMTESAFHYDAVSPSGAVGLWQFMPGTARKYGLKVTYWDDERYLPEKETLAAVRYLRDLYQWFGDWNLALAAYNRGEGGLGQDMKYSRSLNFDALSKRGALPRQTDFYVPNFQASVLIGENPERYGLHPKYETPDPSDLVVLPRALDLDIAARCAGTTQDVIHRLNPELRAWSTPKDDPNFTLRIPQGTKAAFTAALAGVKDWNPGPTLIRYRVRPGDSLDRIARRNNTTVREILKTNKIRRPRLIHPGRLLLIRPGRRRIRRPAHHRRTRRHSHSRKIRRARRKQSRP